MASETIFNLIDILLLYMYTTNTTYDRTTATKQIIISVLFVMYIYIPDIVIVLWHTGQDEINHVEVQYTGI